MGNTIDDIKKNMAIYLFSSKVLLSKRRILLVIPIGIFLSILIISFLALPLQQLNAGISEIRMNNTDLIYSLHPQISLNQIENENYKLMSEFERITYLGDFQYRLKTIENIDRFAYGILFDIELMDETSNTPKLVSMLAISDNLFNNFLDSKYLILQNNDTLLSNKAFIFNQKYLGEFGWFNISRINFRFLFKDLDGVNLTYSLDIDCFGRSAGFELPDNNLLAGNDDNQELLTVNDNLPFFDDFSPSNLAPSSYSSSNPVKSTIGLISISNIDSLLQGRGFNWLDYHGSLLESGMDQLQGISGIYSFVWIKDEFFSRNINLGLDTLINVDSRILQLVNLLNYPVEKVVTTQHIFHSGNLLDNGYLEKLNVQMNLYQILSLILLAPLLLINLFLMFYTSKFTQNTENMLKLKLLRSQNFPVIAVFVLEWCVVSIVDIAFFILILLFFPSSVRQLFADITNIMHLSVLIILLTSLFWLYPSIQTWFSLNTSDSPHILNYTLNERYQEEKMLYSAHKIILRVIVIGIFSCLALILLISIFGASISKIDFWRFFIISLGNSSMQMIYIFLLGFLSFLIILMISGDFISVLLLLFLTQLSLNHKKLRRFKHILLTKQYLKMNRTLSGTCLLVSVLISFLVFFVVIPVVIAGEIGQPLTNRYGIDLVVSADLDHFSSTDAVEIVNSTVGKLNSIKKVKTSNCFKAIGSIPSAFKNVNITTYFIDPRAVEPHYRIFSENNSFSSNTEAMINYSGNILVSKSFAMNYALSAGEFISLLDNQSTPHSLRIIDIIDRINGYGMAWNSNSEKEHFIVASQDILPDLLLSDLNAWITLINIYNEPSVEDELKQIIPPNFFFLSSDNLVITNSLTLDQLSLSLFLENLSGFTLLNTLILLVLITPIYIRGFKSSDLIFRFLGVTYRDYFILISITMIITGLGSMIIGMIVGTLFSILIWYFICSGAFLYDITLIFEENTFWTLIGAISLIITSYLCCTGIILFKEVKKISLSKELKVDM
ncbi:MAG: hypothetical protein ACTSP4_07910 [Candidatus Hodarchaeales archaeon]